MKCPTHKRREKNIPDSHCHMQTNTIAKVSIPIVGALHNVISRDLQIILCNTYCQHILPILQMRI